MQVVSGSNAGRIVVTCIARKMKNAKYKLKTKEKSAQSTDLPQINIIKLRKYDKILSQEKSSFKI
jgi:hypothetical protein